MTRPEQKQHERAVLDHYLAVMGIKGTIEDGPEPPDFIVRTGQQAIAVEVTEYHQPTLTADGHTRREVEAAWARIRKYVVEFRKDVPELDNLSVGLQFSALAVPSTKDVKPFVTAITDKIIAGRNGIDGKFRYLQIGGDDLPILTNYLKSILVRSVGCYMEWDWNHDFAGIGTSDIEMMSAIGVKLRNYKALKEVDENHLVVAGWGGHLSQIAAPMHEAQLNSFEALKAALEASAFDRVTLFDLRDFTWRKETGWQPLGNTLEDA